LINAGLGFTAGELSNLDLLLLLACLGLHVGIAIMLPDELIAGIKLIIFIVAMLCDSVNWAA
jgi:hypothetical protein